MAAPTIPEPITQFLQENAVLTLATSVQNKPFCANCFYIFLPGEPLLVIKSKASTKHIKDALTNPHVSGTVSINTSNVKKIRGLQFVGKMRALPAGLLKKVKRLYYRQYPFGWALSGQFWKIRPHFMRLIDNRLGFGEKLTWTLQTD